MKIGFASPEFPPAASGILVQPHRRRPHV